MFIRISDPVTELQKELNDFLRIPSFQRKANFPLINIRGNKEELIVSAEIPGISPEKIDISIMKDVLFIEGERVKDEAPVVHLQECRWGKFKREIQLPFLVDQEKIVAKYDKGILSVHLERAPETKPKQIKVQF